MNIPTLEQFRSVLEYDPLTGIFRWTVSRPPVVPGDIAGSYWGRTGYRRIRFAGREYAEHRLAWLFVHGEWPPHEVDHINRVRADNRIANLRLATRSENGVNRVYIRTLPRGVVFHKRNKRFQAQIHACGKGHYLGSFETAEEAHAAYNHAAAQLHGEFARSS